MAKSPHDHLNDGAAKGQDRAAQHLPSLTRAYGRALRAAGRRAAQRFRQAEAVTAAAEPNAPPPGWVPPPTLSLIDQQDLADDTQRKTGRLHGRILTDATVPALDPFGIRFDIQAPSSQAILASYAQRIQATIQDAIAEQVTEAIRDGYAAGQSVAQVSRAIQAAVDGISGPRADMLARSDLNGLANAGSLLAAKTTGAAATKTWKTAGDDRVRPDHQDAEGQTVAIGDTFDVGGEALQFPGDPQGSWAEVASCRCVCVYGQPLTASAERHAQPRDFASWRDHAWEGMVDQPGALRHLAAGDTAGTPIASSTPGGPAGILYLARHGLTEYDSDDHAKDTIRGWADDPLNDAGIAEAHRLGQNLGGLGITSVETSDLERAEATAVIIENHLGLSGQSTQALRPWNLGDFQGRTSDDARADIAGYCDNPAEPVPGGESFNDFCSRFLPAVSAAMAQAEAGSSPLLVTHSHNLKLARAWVAAGRAPVDGTAFMQPSPGPAAVLALTPADGGWTITEILCDGVPTDAAEGSVPPAVHYRPSDDPDRACGACEFFVTSASRCRMFEGRPVVRPDYVCDEFVAKSTLTSGGTMSTFPKSELPPVIRVSQEEFDAWKSGRAAPFAASGDTGLPLSERDRAWDAGEATARVKKWASSDGSGDPDKIDYGKLKRAYFWQAPAGDGGPKIGDFSLPFADVLSGKLTAVWRGVTAAAGRLNQTQGVNEAAVKKAVAAYYAKAAKQYSDTTIKVPWAKAGASANGETLAAIRASLADQGADGVLGDDELRAVILAVQAASDLTAAAPTLVLNDFDLTAATAGGTQWQATLCVAGEPTVDSGIKRVLDPDGGSWLPLPRPLALLDDSPHAEVTTKAPICGRIDQIWWAGNVCQASGVFFDDSDDVKLAEAGSKACALVAEFRGQLGISVDLVDTEVEMCAWGDSGPIEMDSANDPTARNYDDAVDPNAPGGPATEANLPNDIPEMEEEVGEEPQYVLRFLQWVIAGATICPVQALTQATIGLVAGGFGSANTYRWWGGEFDAPALTASAAGLAPVHPPRAWFEMEEATEPTPITVEDDGRVYGHIALWDSCHTGFPGRCVPPPKSASEYAGFHLGAIRLEGGETLPVGTLTMDTGHASHGLSAQGAVAHYDHTGTQAAFVRASDGQHGIWVCGTLSPRLDAADAQALMAAKPSGDWREVFRGRGRDMIGALAVNVPGFPVPRTLVASGLIDGADALGSFKKADAELLNGVYAYRDGQYVKTVPLSVEFWSECEPCDAELGRELAVLAASVDGVAGLAALVEA